MRHIFPAMLFSGFVAGLFATGGKACCTRWRRCSTARKFAPPGGTAVAVGRLGAMSGPSAGGKMLALGPVPLVMAASAPGFCWLAWRCSG